LIPGWLGPDFDGKVFILQGLSIKVLFLKELGPVDSAGPFCSSLSLTGGRELFCSGYLACFVLIVVLWELTGFMGLCPMLVCGAPLARG
jgi:hypothetical protein